MSANPYQSQPASAFWRRGVADVLPIDVDPVLRGAFQIAPTEKVATAGSCFAQHIARHLASSGFNFYIAEDAHPAFHDLASEGDNYGVYTARYGNIYSSRQLLQLIRRAYGEFSPIDEAWSRPDGRLVDPFRPMIAPDGYGSLEEVARDREHHLKCVRTAFENLDVFVFTLGLTEIWRSKKDGAVFPLCPGVAGGVFDDLVYEFQNLRVRDVVEDLEAFFRKLKSVNPRARALLTVSPVPLIATALDRHVLTSTSYSKSALRAACEEVAESCPGVAYFPSYEIITGAFNRGAYFASDLRSVTETGVEHVMNLFMRHYTQAGEAVRQPDAVASIDTGSFEQIVRVICDEEAIEKS